MNFRLNENYKNFMSVVMCALLTFALIYIVVKYAFPVVFPFLLAWLVAAILQKPVVFAEKKLKIPKKVAASFIVLLFLSVLFIIIFTLAGALIRQGGDFIARISAESDIIAERIEVIFGKAGAFFEKFGIKYDGGLPSVIVDTVKNVLMAAATYITTQAAHFVSALPHGLIFTVVLLLSSIYFCSDYRSIVKFILSALPKRASGFVSTLKKEFGTVMTKYVRSYFIIFLLTFAELFLGLTLIGTGGALVISLITAVIDILPVLGTGAVLIPWAIVKIILGDAKTGLLIVLLYIVITIVRQVTEPKIVGEGLGLHPSVSLITMYIGLRSFGVFGMITAPIIFAIFKNAVLSAKKAGEDA